ncbi:phosphoribosyltransferase [Prochlorococcus marinus str. MU1404]|uniref:phosphoribosyltransferase n=1 Tax=Prochlorococcus marinus TaxID=1219 RepID=UPI001ADCF57B|nr:phosphoribosyltransferase [Prochlorococcus marinus]MBW3073011.1 phosphoribosyltransferase [Prochlorococcus marinus str. MU1404]MCR8545446.1 phosphoribosyltransferase [Prochlorococcus marinus CUG1432]
MISYFTWSDFDESVEHIANKCKLLEFSGIYGVPRGGLCLAVALSHKLKINLISEPIKNSLIVDDIYETGITLNTLKDIEGATFFVLFSKVQPKWWNTVHISEKKEWIVFPWENILNIKNDRNDYTKKRGLI